MEFMAGGPERLYYHDEYVKTFTAHVLSCEETDKGFRITLDRTAFYPEGGGQPCDHGTLGGAQVIDVREKGGEIYHLCKTPLEVGSEVEGVIDWERRLYLMQQHTGEHIFSGIIHAKYGYENVGFHMGTDAVTVDFNGDIPVEELPEIERLTNTVIWENIPVQVTYPTPEELETIEYRSKKALTGQVRIVTVPGSDVCACCGTHVRYTGEVGLVKIIASQKYKGGIRISLQMGMRAVEHYHKLLESVSGISQLLAAKQGEVLQAVERLTEEAGSLRQQLSALRKESFLNKLQDCAGDVLLFIEAAGLTPSELSQFCMAACEKGKVAAVFSGDDASGYKYAYGSVQTDIRPLGKALNTALDGRGGGSAALVQGGVRANAEAIRAYFQALEV